MARLITGRVKKTPQSGITSDRYEFLGLDQAEPDLGDPLIGPSSTGAKPFPPGNQYVLINVGGQTGKRYWIESTSLIPPGLTPGSFTVFNNDTLVGAANSFNKFNFVGTGVTVDFVGPNFADQTGIATIRIAVNEVLGIGNDYEIAYNNPVSGNEEGATGFVYRNGRVGIGSTIPTQTLDVNGTVGFTTINVVALNIGAGATIFKTDGGNIGIGTTIPKYSVEFSKSIGISSLFYDGKGSPGSDSDVLISKGAGSPPEWVTLGEATPTQNSNKVKTTNTIEDRLFYIGFSSVSGNSFGQLYVDSDNLYYNPDSVKLGIGTQPEYALDVSGTIRADQIIADRLSSFSGILTTTSTATAVLDTFNSGQFRSSRYSIQTTTKNRLSNYSISELSSGSQYSPGTYQNVSLISGLTGEQATANITVGPRISTQLSSTTLSGGIFTTTGSIAGIPTATLVAFGTTINPNPYEESKITELQIINSGAGFTSVPNIVFDSPTIIGNPVLGVGVGSTALVTDVSMKVTNAILNSANSSTTVPIVVFSSPVGPGLTAQGTVGFGISTFTITSAGSSYTSPPTVSYDQTPTSTPVVSVGLGISDANIQITPGSGYDGTTSFTITPVGGIGTDATIILGSLDGSGGITDIDITNIGTGYTTPPTVTVNGTGVGAAVTITELVLANLDIVSTGSGFTTSKPTVTLIGGGGTDASAVVNEVIATNVNITNPGYGYTGPVTAAFNVIGVAASVALGINSLSITSGLGYESIPDVTIDSPTLSPFTGAILTPTLGYDPEFDLLPGPGYGGTTYYYIDPIDNNTFRITKDFAGTDYITLGYDVSTNPNVYIDGIVTNVDIQNQGSRFEIGEVITVNNNNLYSSFSEVVGSGFSFTVSNLVESFQTSEILLLQSVGSATTNSSIIEYGGISDTENLIEYSTDIIGNTVRLKVTPNYEDNVVIYDRFPIRVT